VSFSNHYLVVRTSFRKSYEQVVKAAWDEAIIAIRQLEKCETLF